MTCTKEEIERKRLAALEKRQNKLSKNPAGKPFVSERSNFGPVRSTSENRANIGFHPYANRGNIHTAENVLTTFTKSLTVTCNRNQNNLSPTTDKLSGQFIEQPNSDSHKALNPNTIRLGPTPSQSQGVSVKVYLISEHRFEVSISEFCIPLINIFKTIPSGTFDTGSKLWSFCIDDYQSFISKVASLEPQVTIASLPSFVLKILKYPILDPDNVDLTPIEETVRNKLMPFQEDGVRFAIARQGRCLIADEMGLGKTFQALAIASYYRPNWPLLIITTSSMRETWQSKIHELLPSVPMSNIALLASGKDSQLVADKQTEVVISSYKIASTHKELLQKKKFGVVIVDESHYLKSYKAQCTSALMSIGSKCARVILLSGTPALSRPSELYTQLALIEPSVFNSYNTYIQFGVRYCDGKQTSFGWDMSGTSHLPELQAILRKRFLIRRSKIEVLTDLGEITRESVYLDQNLLNYAEVDEKCLSQMAETYKKSTSTAKHAALITYFSKTAAVKIPAVCKYIKQTLKEYDGKFLVFAHHRNMIEAICNTLMETHTEFICIVGSTPANMRAELVSRFQVSRGVRAAVLSVTAAGAGLSLTAAALVLFAELHWNPGVLTQAEARAHRLGGGAVVARYLLARACADDAVWPMLCGKLHVLNDVGLTGETFEDTTVKHQESKSNITNYLSPKPTKNKNDFIPGTNIRKSAVNIKTEPVTPTNSQTGSKTNTQNKETKSTDSETFDEIDEFILNYDEDDDLLAGIDMDI
ncbi:unnamed protein product, partial [Brenthis ino]